jgi:uridylate kinase
MKNFVNAREELAGSLKIVRRMGANHDVARIVIAKGVDATFSTPAAAAAQAASIRAEHIAMVVRADHLIVKVKRDER